mmetsp:Transcript_119901/g.334520  ORF Transcript_119901/g.334520 Transcript_119901/m.334520 type:complete len:500 (+) Transcript_119901:51-1550(+)|eukprot:CAMPEP_0179022380 /NCGR_PEP_ID=MMETSP0796-20121207/6378_1 /TAXON_ID=73915 /ORGANISM="Pyrodinium bahamense, Strain pbaha01" /LENGTH=499 /DNA_ID=CAMNT_0020718245 /DNA_START=42 /DNA_END=1541 /DNA_ORIENTATION=-
MSTAGVESPPKLLDHPFRDVSIVQEHVRFTLLTSLRQFAAACNTCADSLPVLADDTCVKDTLTGALLRSLREVTAACAVWAGHLQKGTNELGRCAKLETSAEDHTDGSAAEQGFATGQGAQVQHSVGELEAMYEALDEQQELGFIEQAESPKTPDSVVSCCQQAMVISAGDSVEDPDTAPLFMAVQSQNRSEVMQLLAQASDPNITDSSGETPLFEAVATGQTDVAALLLLHSADPNKQSFANMVASEVASPVCRILLDLFMGIDVDEAEQNTVFAVLDDAVGGRVREHLAVDRAKGGDVVLQEEQNDNSQASCTKECRTGDRVADAVLSAGVMPSDRLLLGTAVLDKPEACQQPRSDSGQGPDDMAVEVGAQHPTKQPSSRRMPTRLITSPPAASPDGREPLLHQKGAAGAEDAGVLNAGARCRVVDSKGCGIQVRAGPDLTSAVYSQRLAHGSEISVLECRDKRVRYCLLQGSGPETGWITTSMKAGRSVLECVSAI